MGQGIYVDGRAVGHPGDLLDNTFNIELRSPNPSKTNSKQQLLPRWLLGAYPNLILLAPTLNTTTVIITLSAICDIVVAIEVPMPPYRGIRR